MVKVVGPSLSQQATDLMVKYRIAQGVAFSRASVYLETKRAASNDRVMQSRRSEFDRALSQLGGITAEFEDRGLESSFHVDQADYFLRAVAIAQQAREMRTSQDFKGIVEGSYAVASKEWKYGGLGIGIYRRDRKASATTGTCEAQIVMQGGRPNLCFHNAVLTALFASALAYFSPIKIVPYFIHQRHYEIHNINHVFVGVEHQNEFIGLDPMYRRMATVRETPMRRQDLLNGIFLEYYMNLLGDLSKEGHFEEMARKIDIAEKLEPKRFELGLAKLDYLRMMAMKAEDREVKEDLLNQRIRLAMELERECPPGVYSNICAEIAECYDELGNQSEASFWILRCFGDKPNLMVWETYTKLRHQVLNDGKSNVFRRGVYQVQRFLLRNIMPFFNAPLMRLLFMSQIGMDPLQPISSQRFYLPRQA